MFCCILTEILHTFASIIQKFKKQNDMKIEIEKCSKSRIWEMDFSQSLPFGKYMSDHMFICKWENGAWGTPRITPYQKLSIAPSSKVFHYGQAIFEGMKAFRDKNDKIFLFRPKDNIERFNKSAVRMNMPEFPEDLFYEALHTLVGMDRDWVPSGEGRSYYIRPFMIGCEEALNAVPSAEYIFMIIGGPVDAIFKGEVKVKIADHFSRAANGGTGFAKCAGNYGGQFYPSTLAKEEGYQSVIWTDDSTHTHLEEAGQMNYMMRIGDTLRTAPVSDRILDGITRRSILRLAEDMGIKTDVSPILVEEVLEAGRRGEIKEAFGCGTAAVISPISGLGYKDTHIDIPALPDEESFGERLRQRIFDIQYNRTEDPYGWRVEVK